QPDGSYRIKGQKIFITYGEHDYTDNIVHLTLARIDGAPEGVKGISLFAVPKFNVNADGSVGSRNDVKCVSIEHKLGIHASPTAVLAFGEKEGALGYLVGEPHRSQALVDLLIPVVKGWSTEMGIEIASLGVQVHGGMGFIEETGAAQHLRDARITTIYEGTTGIQANDLVGRKMGREEGRTA